METRTDNEIIAAFMGVKIGVDLYSWRPGVSNPIRVEDLAYDKEWGWLMPVVEKISQHVYESYQDNNGYKDVTVHERAYPRTFGMIDNEGRWMVRINRMHLEQEDTLIKATYNAVVEWIKANQPQKAS